QVRVLESRHHDRRQKLERLAVRLGEKEGDDGELGDVELEVAHDALEGGGRSLHVGEVEERRIALERLRNGVIAHQRFQLPRPPGTRRVLRNSSSPSPRKAATISGFETPLL